MNKKKLMLLAAALVANIAVADSSIEIGLKAGYRHVKDSHNQKATWTGGSGFFYSNAGTIVADAAAAAAAAASNEAFTTEFDVKSSSAKDSFIALTLPVNFSYDNWKLGLQLAYGFGTKTKSGNLEVDANTFFIRPAANPIVRGQVTKSKYNAKKSNFFEVMPKIGYEFQINDSFSLTPSVGWEFTTYNRKAEDGKIEGGTKNFKVWDVLLPKGSKTKINSPFIELEAKFKPSEDVSFSLAARYSMPQVYTGQMIDLNEYYSTASYILADATPNFVRTTVANSATPNVVMKDVYKKRANQFSIQADLNWALNDAWGVDLYANARFLNGKATKAMTKQSRGNGAGNNDNLALGYKAEGTMAGKRKMSTYEFGLGTTYSF